MPAKPKFVPQFLAKELRPKRNLSQGGSTDTEGSTDSVNSAKNNAFVNSTDNKNSSENLKDLRSVVETKGGDTPPVKPKPKPKPKPRVKPPPPPKKPGTVASPLCKTPSVERQGTTSVGNQGTAAEDRITATTTPSSGATLPTGISTAKKPVILPSEINAEPLPVTPPRRKKTIVKSHSDASLVGGSTPSSGATLPTGSSTAKKPVILPSEINAEPLPVTPSRRKKTIVKSYSDASLVGGSTNRSEITSPQGGITKKHAVPFPSTPPRNKTVEKKPSVDIPDKGGKISSKSLGADNETISSKGGSTLKSPPPLPSTPPRKKSAKQRGLTPTNDITPTVLPSGEEDGSPSNSLSKVKQSISRLETGVDTSKQEESWNNSTSSSGSAEKVGAEAESVKDSDSAEGRRYASRENSFSRFKRKWSFKTKSPKKKEEEKSAEKKLEVKESKESTQEDKRRWSQHSSTSVGKSTFYFETENADSEEDKHKGVQENKSEVKDEQEISDTKESKDKTFNEGKLKKAPPVPADDSNFEYTDEGIYNNNVFPWVKSKSFKGKDEELLDQIPPSTTAQFRDSVYYESIEFVSGNTEKTQTEESQDDLYENVEIFSQLPSKSSTPAQSSNNGEDVYTRHWLNLQQEAIEFSDSLDSADEFDSFSSDDSEEDKSGVEEKDTQMHVVGMILRIAENFHCTVKIRKKFPS